MIITSAQYTSQELLESDINQYRAALIAHSQTTGVPAPWPPNELVEAIVKNNLEWEWQELPPETIAEIIEDEPINTIPEPLQGFEFVSDLYNDFLARKFYFDELADYQQLRAKEYPTISDQLDAMFHAGMLPEPLMAQIREVKNKYPKPSPFPSWIYNSNTCQWEAPVVCPDDGKQYRWDEATTSWIEAE